VALQLEWGGKLTVTVLAGGVAFPTFTALLLKLQVMFHMVHKPLNDSEQVQKNYILTFSIQGISHARCTGFLIL